MFVYNKNKMSQNNTMSCLKIIIFILLLNLMLSCFNCHSICSCNRKIHSLEKFDVDPNDEDKEE